MPTKLHGLLGTSIENMAVTVSPHLVRRHGISEVNHPIFYDQTIEACINFKSIRIILTIHAHVILFSASIS